MSLRINTNLAAMMALERVGQAEEGLQKSIERLSTGMRINQASDDPSGLILSESLRSAIRGVETATRNSQDGINMSKLAEGSFAEIARLLGTLKGLAVSAANSAVADVNQTQGYQSEIQSVLSSIDRISDTTVWGGRKLLSGASGTVVNVTAGDQVSSLSVASTFGGDNMMSGSISMTRVSSATQATTGQLARRFAATSTSVTPGVFAINGTTFNVAAGDTVAVVLDKINLESANTHVTATFTPGQGIVLTSTKYGTRYPINYVESANILNNDSAATATNGVDAVFDVTMPTDGPGGFTTERFTGGVATTDDGLTLTSTTGNKLQLTSSGNLASGSQLIGSVSVGDMRFQIGGGATDSVNFGIPSVTTQTMGNTAVTGKVLADIDVTSGSGAQDAIRIIDDAINRLSTVRSQLGTFQRNVLEANVRSLGVAAENLTATESSIRDLDVATEMTNYTKLQIIRQSGVAVLAQANRLPESVLELLKGI